MPLMPILSTLMKQKVLRNNLSRVGETNVTIVIEIILCNRSYIYIYIY